MSRKQLTGSIILLAITALALALHNIPNITKHSVPVSHVSGLVSQVYIHPEQSFLINGPIDINLATTKELETIPRIGPSLAKKITDLRAKRGRLDSLDNLLEVNGIGPRILETIRPYLRVD